MNSHNASELPLHPLNSRKLSGNVYGPGPFCCTQYCLEQHAERLPSSDPGFHEGLTFKHLTVEVKHLVWLQGQDSGAQREGVGVFAEGTVSDRVWGSHFWQRETPPTPPCINA